MHPKTQMFCNITFRSSFKTLISGLFGRLIGRPIGQGPEGAKAGVKIQRHASDTAEAGIMAPPSYTIP